MRRALRLTLVVGTAIICGGNFIFPALAEESDWGYSDTTGATAPGNGANSKGQGGSAGSRAQTGSLPFPASTTVDAPSKERVLHKQNSSATAPQPSYFSRGVRKGSGTSTASTHSPESAVAHWLELYQLAARQPLTAEQKARAEQILRRNLASNNSKQRVLSISSYWSQLQEKVNSSVDNKETAISFFRALLRFAQHNPALEDDEKDLLGELLGAERIAVPAEDGAPALTEEAIDAYADMACFLYEINHPGKTIDASDNRTLMAAVISDKFHHAPDVAAKKAMANFALNWAKFKMIWLQSDEPTRKELVESLQKGANVFASKNPFVDNVLGSGPWAVKSSTPAVSHEVK